MRLQATLPTAAGVRRALADLDVQLDRAERQIDGLLEHQARLSG